jgi:RNA 2',3'-cyclic 3'-phosphodiesterase
LSTAFEEAGLRQPEPEKTIRCFLALEIPGTVRTGLAELAEPFRSAGLKAAWVRPENLHLTLRFLGGVGEARLRDLAVRLRCVCAEQPALRLAVRGIGAFPNQRRPAVLWAGAEVLDGDISALHKAVEKAVRAAYIPPDNRRFHPHITLARFRGQHWHGRLPELLRKAEKSAAEAGDAFPVASVTLFRSDLKPGGPVYTQLEEFDLSC